MASDISSIIKQEICSTLDSLLSIEASISETTKITQDDLSLKQCVSVDIEFTFSVADAPVKMVFYIPTATATKFEFLMLGGIGDLKEAIDDEISDAVNEIVSNICGSIVTAINGQAFEDIGSSKFSITTNRTISCSDISALENTFKFELKLKEETLEIFITFEPSLMPFVAKVAQDDTVVAQPEVVSSSSSSSSGGRVGGAQPEVNPIMQMLGQESVENLKLLFDIRFKLSVRLGTKTLLLKDITNWDTGTIVELEQMVNEPLDILANGVKIGAGEAVIIDGRFGVKIKKIGNEKLN